MPLSLTVISRKQSLRRSCLLFALCSGKFPALFHPVASRPGVGRGPGQLSGRQQMHRPGCWKTSARTLSTQFMLLYLVLIFDLNRGLPTPSSCAARRPRASCLRPSGRSPPLSAASCPVSPVLVGRALHIITSSSSSSRRRGLGSRRRRVVRRPAHVENRSEARPCVMRVLSAACVHGAAYRCCVRSMADRTIAARRRRSVFHELLTEAARGGMHASSSASIVHRSVRALMS